MAIDKDFEQRVMKYLETGTQLQAAKYFRKSKRIITEINKRNRVIDTSGKFKKSEKLSSHYYFTHHKDTDNFILDAF